MAYTPQQWHDDNTNSPYGPISGDRLNYIEAGIQAAAAAADAAGTAGGASAGTALPIVDGVASAGTAATTSRVDHVHPTDTTRAPLASPTFTGTVTVPSVVAGNPTFTGTVVLPSSTVTSAMIVDGTIVNADVSASAAIAVSKLSVGTAAQVLTTTNGTAVWATPSAGGGTVTLPIAESDVTNLTTDLAAKAPLASPTFTGTVTVPSVVAGSPTFSGTVTIGAMAGTPTLPSPTVATTQSSNDNSTKLATTAYVTAQDKLSGGAYQFAPNSYWNFPYYVAGSQVAVANAGDGRWTRVMMGQSGTLHDVSFMVNTTGGNYNIIILDDGQANATHTTRTCLALKGSTATPAASAYITYDPALTVAAGDTLVFMVTFDGTSAKVAASTGSLGGIAMPANFFPGSGASTAASKVCGTILSANVPGSVNATVTDANMVAAANGPFCIWRIS